MTPVVVLAVTSNDMNRGTWAVMAAIVAFTQVVKAIDWMRLFGKTAFYIELIIQTLIDVAAFMLLVGMSLLLFGIPLVMLNTEAGENSVVEGIFPFWLINSIINQYLLALGEFSTLENFAEQPHAGLCYVFFVLATFFTMLTMLNMLIAIMGDTFERVTENKELNSIKTKLKIVSELMYNIPLDEGDDKSLLFVVTPDDDGENDVVTWEGTVN